MAGSAGLGIVRLLVLAALLSVEDYGIYSIGIAIVMFLSSLPALGLVEETRKSYPRLYADGRADEIVARADHVTRLVGRRTAVIGAVAVIGALTLGYHIWAIGIAALTILAFGVAWSLVMASALRAGGSPFPLAATSFIRAIVTLILCVAVAKPFGLMGVLWGEAIGALIGSSSMRFALRRLYGNSRKASPETYPTHASQAGMLVFLGMLFVSAPAYLNRPVAALAMPPAEVGTLALLLVLVSVLQTTVGIIDQIVGPRLIHWERAGLSLNIQKRRLFLIIGSLALFCFLCFGLIWQALHLPLVSPIIEKYALSGTMMLPAAVLSAFSITTIIDWMLQAHNLERWVTIAAIGNLATFGFLTLLVILGNIGMLAYLWGIAAAKFCQLCIQLVTILRMNEA